jgi:cyclophilin family peptidyl-prolyl cis-trans isomerase/HEAT repeat protein
MRVPLLSAALAVCWLGCSRGASAPPRPPASPAAIAIAEAEARRAGGVDELIGLASAGSTDRRDAGVQVRARALRGLGRAGGEPARRALAAALATGTGDEATAAAAGLGVAAVLDVLDGAAAGEVAAALAAPGSADRAVVVEALGRGGDAGALAVLTAALGDGDPRTRAAAGIALGRLGRRQIALDDAARAALIAASASVDRGTRHGAVYGLSRELRGEGAAPDPAVIAALIARIADRDAEIRAVAVAGLGRRGPVAVAAVSPALLDADWRVVVEAVRALAGAGDDGRDAVAAHLVREHTRLADRAPGASPHPLLEGLRALAPHAARPAVRAALTRIAAARGPDLVAGWAQCLALAALARTGGADALAAVRDCGPGLPAYHRAALIAEAIGAGAGGEPAARWTALAAIIADADGRASAAALAAVPALWPDLPAASRDAAALAVADRLGTSDSGVAGAAAEAIGALLARPDAAAQRAALVTPLVTRASRPASDPELASTLLGVVAGAKLAEGQALCDRARSDAAAVVAAAARACVTALTGTDPGPVATPALPRPPVSPADVLGRTVTWTVETSRGTVVIALEPELAPWHVAAIASLTGRGFYDGLVFHRVVPGFVVQGGDPAGAGWGGPGFSLPSEPAGGQAAGGGGFERGAVGIADAGRDSGGSQWFVMHGHAPHLEGRYTRIGRVESGMEAVDALVVGDTIVRATVTVE